MEDVGVVNEQYCREVAALVRDGAHKVSSVSFAFVGMQDRDTNNSPASWSGAIALTQALELHLNRAASKILGVTVGGSQEVLHLLNGRQHRFNRFLWDAEGLKHERGNRVSDAVIAIGGVDGAQARCKPRLSDDVVEEHLGERAVVGGFALLTIDFLGHEPISSHIVHHADPVNDLVSEVEVGLHKKNST